MWERLRATAVLVLVVLVGAVVSAAPARAEEGEPFARSAATTYQVTFVARACASYADVMANQVRDDAGETPGRPGRDSTYKAGQPVDPDIEERSACEPMPGAAFTLGAGRVKKGALSTVTGGAEPVTTVAGTGRLDAAGRPTGGPIAGAVTVTLAEAQMNLAGKRELWAQGGTPAVLVPGGHSFAVLRCGIDGRTGGNTQWIGFPSGARHVFCYAYYVRGAAATGTLTVKLRTTRAVGYPQRVPFTSTLSQSGTFVLTADSSQTSYVRLSGQAYRLAPQLPAGWQLTDVSCAASTVVVDLGTGQVDVTLVSGENVTCEYVLTPPPARIGLTLRAFAEGGAGTFGLTVAGSAAASPSGGTGGVAPTERALTAAPKGDGSAATATGADLSTLAPGRYTVTVSSPAADAAQWSLTGAACNGSPVPAQGRTVEVNVGTAVTDCVLRLVRKQGSVTLKVITQGSVATAGFALRPAASAEAGWAAAATTGRAATAVPATGDVPGSLAFGSYLLVPVAPLATVDAAWRLTSIGCNPGPSGGPDTQVVQLDLTSSAAVVECTATYEMTTATQVRLRLMVDGSTSRSGPTALDLTCADGSAGRVVLGSGDNGPADLPQPLLFVADTSCTIGLTEGTERPLNASLVIESAVGNAPLPLPATVSVATATSGASGGTGTPGGEPEDIRLTVTLNFDGPGVAEKQRANPIESFGFLPVALIGSGLIGIGGAVLLVLVARRRIGVD